MVPPSAAQLLRAALPELHPDIVSDHDMVGTQHRQRLCQSFFLDGDDPFVIADYFHHRRVCCAGVYLWLTHLHLETRFWGRMT